MSSTARDHMIVGGAAAVLVGIYIAWAAWVYRRTVVVD